MSHAHAEELHPNPLITSIGVVSALAAAWFLTLILPAVFHAPRFATGIAIGAIGILTGAFSNSAGLFPNLQRWMETFGITLFACAFMRFLHVSDILSKGEGFIGSLGKVMMMFM